MYNSIMLNTLYILHNQSLQELYLPFIDEQCIRNHGFPNFTLSNLTESTPDTLHYRDFYENPSFQRLLLEMGRTAGLNTGQITTHIGECFIRETTCRWAVHLCLFVWGLSNLNRMRCISVEREREGQGGRKGRERGSEGGSEGGRKGEGRESDH